jgi:hypothetical protein
MFDHTNSNHTHSATSSPASADGVGRCSWLAGQQTDLFGQAVVPASLSARQAKALGLLTSGTFGPRSSTSSASAALQSSLASKLPARTDSLGSTLYRLTWKERVTPSGRRICALRASAPRTSDSDSTGWPAPAARDWKGATLERWGDNARPLNEVAVLAGWPTPVVNDATGSDYAYSQGNHDKVTLKLGGTAKLAGWPTATTPSGGRPVSIEKMDITGRTKDGKKHTASLEHAVKFVGQARLTASGEMLIGSTAGMESGGVLNPAHSRWLQGYSREWCDCGVAATQSFLKSRKRSSKRRG